jgi:hypothetical protein
VNDDALEIQNDVPDLTSDAEKLRDALCDAESCETLSDLAANLLVAREAFENMKKELLRLERAAARLLKAENAA